ncbi:MAG: Sua5/YciO/YrdC/YwlC family protein [Mariprofundaceae bacterium]|nr:Sua5/YciO/YrdC/YwlC family protein [Mariprofundaceae bacterium]
MKSYLKHCVRRVLPKLKRQLSLLRHAKWMQQGKLLAHHTSTLAGVGCSVSSLAALCSFKQRKGPFLLLASDMSSALKWARYISPALRQFLQHGWPDKTTLIFPAKKGLDACLYQQGMIAVRVDSDLNCCFLAKEMGGCFVSSSLNRRGQRTKTPICQQAWRWQRFQMRSLVNKSHQHCEQASTILRVTRLGMQRLR